MKKHLITFSFTFAALIWMGTAALPVSPPMQVLEPALNDIAKKIRACQDFSGAVSPGQTIKVTLNPPPELGGTGPGPCSLPGTGTYNPRPTRPPSGSTGGTYNPPTSRPPSGSTGGAYNPPSTGRVGLRSSSRPSRRPLIASSNPRTASRALVDDIPCTELPVGCQPIPIPGGKLENVHMVATWSIYQPGGSGEILVNGADYQGGELPGGAFQALMGAPYLAEYTGEKPPQRSFAIKAMVKVVADKTTTTVPSTKTTVSSAEFPVELPFPLNPLEIPPVFVLFLDPTFSGAAAIYLPQNSKLTEEQLRLGARQLLKTYRDVGTRLGFITWFASFVTGLQELDNVFQLPHWDLKELKNAEPNLNEDDFIYRSPYTSLNDTEVEDESSSMFLMGLPDTKVQFFQHRSYKGGEFYVETGGRENYAPFVSIKSFVNMESLPLGKASVVKPFYHPLGPPNREIPPNDQLSSFKWVR